LQAEVLGVDPREVSVPVVGGHAGITILPLLSQVSYADAITLKILILTIRKNSLALVSRNC
jgi:malate dehydrogenase